MTICSLDIVVDPTLPEHELRVHPSAMDSLQRLLHEAESRLLPRPSPLAIESEAVRALRLGLIMRGHQVAYFRTRDAAILRASKAAERAFDEAAERLLDPPNPPAQRSML